MDYDKDKVDETTLALMYLVTWDREEGMEARAWKGFDWSTMDRLHQKGYIREPKGKAESVVMMEESFKKAEEVFFRLFSKAPK